MKPLPWNSASKGSAGFCPAVHRTLTLKVGYQNMNLAGRLTRFAYRCSFC